LIFSETSLPGVFVVDIEPANDERGFFARSWCKKECEILGIDAEFVQCGISYNNLKGTLRGMHYQVPPHEEAKLVRCTKGAIHDVVLDVRQASPTYRQWVALELTDENHRMMYIPTGMAHGFQTLADNSEVYYQMTASHQPESTRGSRWDDPFYSIDWPLRVTNISERDLAFSLVSSYQ
jgi:dTDP-4-dehydrorhamnose 3,5-epimerase